MIVLGVDPGATSCGLIIRHDAELVSHITVIRAKTMDRAAWIEACLEAALNLQNPLEGFGLLAVEDVNTPKIWHNGKRQVLDPTPMLDTVAIAGAVAGWAWTEHVEVVWVPPGHNGQGPLTAYPDQLQPTRSRGAGKDSLRHERSAYDVSIVGERIYRAEAKQNA